MIQASFILTYRETADPARRRNLLAVLGWLAQYPSQCEVVVVEQDDAPRLDGPLPHPDCRHLFAYNPGAFNKSWGFNVGFRASRNPWLAFGDADVIVGPCLAEALRYLQLGYHAVKPYRRLLDLSEQESARIAGGDYDWVPRRETALPVNREGEGQFICFAGGLLLMSRAGFTRVGGWDERFLGWGGEDDAMSYKLERVQLPAVELDRRPALHLHHARPRAATLGQPHYPGNQQLLAQYLALEDDALWRFAEVQMQIIGHREKYRPQ